MAIRLGGLELHSAPFATTEADTWLYDPASKTVVAGDLVVIPAPLFDSGCAQGWRKALDAIARQPFYRLIPGHGPSLSRASFESTAPRLGGWSIAPRAMRRSKAVSAAGRATRHPF